ncbi:MAG: hypothetical protein JTJ26_06875 [Prevotella sp.]|nr:hypothetical protein [Prevotella sp.]
MKKFMFAAIAAMVMVSVSNVFASSKMVSNSEVAPVDTVAPETPADTLATGTPIQPQASIEYSTKTEENTQTTEEPAKVQETPQEETTQQEATEQQATEQQITAE